MKLNLRKRFLLPTLSLIIVGMGISSAVSYVKSRDALRLAITGQVDQLADSTVSVMASWLKDRKLDIGSWSQQKVYRTAVMDSFVDAGVDGIDPIDPLAKMDLATVKERWGDKMAIKGNVDCAYLLVDGPKEKVIEATKNCIRIAGPGGGYACSTSNSVHSGVKPEFYLAMLETIREYGLYPLDLDRLAPAKNGH